MVDGVVPAARLHPHDRADHDIFTHLPTQLLTYLPKGRWHILWRAHGGDFRAIAARP